MTVEKNYYNQKLPSSYENTEDGGLIIHNVIAMAAGEWTSMQGTTTRFLPEVLSLYATNWEDTGVWTRHPGGAPRESDAKVGAVLNARYDPSLQAVVVDVYLSRKTTQSNNMAELVRLPKGRGGITDVSAETLLETDKNGIVTSLTFTGLSFVEAGACEVCKVPAYSKNGNIPAVKAGGGKEMAEKETPPTGKGGNIGDPGEQEPSSIQGQILDMILPLLEGSGVDISEIIKEAIGATDDISRAEKMGALKYALACHSKDAEVDVPLDTEDAPFSKKDRETLVAFQKELDDLKKENITLNAAYQKIMKEPGDTISKMGGLNKIPATDSDIVEVPANTARMSFAGMRK
ncbi:MAG: hypothetical protein WC936_06125 [Candidatus Nanoarchaeia archaeon]|jgi:hypothetical protein